MKSPLRYPGGKSRAIKTIMEQVPSFTEYREPMVGGGSVFLAMKDAFPDACFSIGDIYQDLALFWTGMKWWKPEIVNAVRLLKKRDGLELYYMMKEWKPVSVADIAVRFFVLNRITFSGLGDSGGYSENAYQKRFTDSSIDRLEALEIRPVTIKLLDYAWMNAPGDDVFVFLDPPYYSNSKKGLYGKRGNLHKDFDHRRFRDTVVRCPHKWLVTYDDCPEVRMLYKDYEIIEWELQYGMNNSSKPATELMIRGNY